MTQRIKRAISIGAIVAASLAASSAHAQLTFQGVTFTPSWAGNVLTLEVDAANATDDWADANFIGALQIKDIGSWTNVSMTGPGLAGTWAIVGDELGANGCEGGSGGVQRICASGTPVALTDNMIFQFTFTGGTQAISAAPHVKVQMFETLTSDRKIGSLMSLDVPTVSAIPEPGTYAMLLGGLGILALARRNAKKAA